MKFRLQYRDSDGVATEALQLSSIKTLKTFSYSPSFVASSGLAYSYHSSDFTDSIITENGMSGYCSVEYWDGDAWVEGRNSTFVFDSVVRLADGTVTLFYLGMDQVLAEAPIDASVLSGTIDGLGRLALAGDGRSKISTAVSTSVDAPVTVTIDTAVYSSGSYTPPVSLPPTSSVLSLIRAYETFGVLCHYWDGFDLILYCRTVTDKGGTGVDGVPHLVKLGSSLAGPVVTDSFTSTSTATSSGVRFSYTDSGSSESHTVTVSGGRPYSSLKALQAPESVHDGSTATAYAAWFEASGIEQPSDTAVLKCSFEVDGLTLSAYTLGSVYSVDGSELALSHVLFYLEEGLLSGLLVFGRYDASVAAMIALL